jgi:S-adenosylmethionine synthetase
MNFKVVPLLFPRLTEQEVEIVERKGVGHPDTLTDALAEAYSIALSKFYVQKFKKVLHHNVDKAVLVGGKANPTFGGGEVEEPIKFYMVGRATTEFEGVKIPVREIYEESAKKWIKGHLRYLDPERHMQFIVEVRPGSPDLVKIFSSHNRVPSSNDTSFGVGFAPLTPTERAVLEVEDFLNSEDFKMRHAESGEDVKVMAVRINNRIDLTISIAFVSRFVSSLEDYNDKKKAITEEIKAYINEKVNMDVEVKVNVGDLQKENSVYITVTGTSAEGGDDGQVGRGNRANGLITPMRPMSLEALAGKNPISHVGKLYNVLARDVAKRLVKEVEEIEEAYVYLVSEIGRPITDPQIAQLSLRTKDGMITAGIREISLSILKEEIEKLPFLWRRFIEQRVTIY